MSTPLYVTYEDFLARIGEEKARVAELESVRDALIELANGRAEAIADLKAVAAHRKAEGDRIIDALVDALDDALLIKKTREGMLESYVNLAADLRKQLADMVVGDNRTFAEHRANWKADLERWEKAEASLKAEAADLREQLRRAIDANRAIAYDLVTAGPMAVLNNLKHAAEAVKPTPKLPRQSFAIVDDAPHPGYFQVWGASPSGGPTPIATFFGPKAKRDASMYVAAKQRGE
jgi:hypothetical protein